MFSCLHHCITNRAFYGLKVALANASEASFPYGKLSAQTLVLSCSEFDFNGNKAKPKLALGQTFNPPTIMERKLPLPRVLYENAHAPKWRKRATPLYIRYG